MNQGTLGPNRQKERRVAMWAIARKDMLGIGANIQVWLPMLILPLVFGVLLPGGLLCALGEFGAGASQLAEIAAIFDNVPEAALTQTWLGLESLAHETAYFGLN